MRLTTERSKRRSPVLTSTERCVARSVIAALVVTLIAALGPINAPSAQAMTFTEGPDYQFEYRTFAPPTGTIRFDWNLFGGAEQLPYYIHQDLIDDDFDDAIHRAFATMQNDPGSQISFVYMGPTTVTSEIVVNNGTCCGNPSDGVNVISYGSLPAPAAAFGGFAGPFNIDSNGQPTGQGTGDFDITLSDTAAFSDGPQPGTSDVESIVLHELGHALGLGHPTTNQDTVMWDILANNTTKRVLHPADLQALAILYGCGSATCSPGCDAPGSISQAECDALLALYNNTNGAGWIDNTGWASSDDPCSWFGVECAGGSVVRLSLDSNNLVGTLPAQIGDLVGLTHLFLQKNQLVGSIPPEIGSLVNLELFYAHKNDLSGSIPAEIGDLANLGLLFLQSNQLTGTIPAALGDLTALTYLRLDRNSFSGGIPPELGSLPNLERLYLQRTEISGPIPSSLANLGQLEYLYLQVNDLTGTVPGALTGLPSLERLFLYKNELSGSIPPALANLSTLRRLYISDNNFDGSIPPELAGLQNLQMLALFGNDLTGSIPPELGGMQSLELLYLFSNDLTGSIPPELGDLPNIERIYLHKNELSGSVPAGLGNAKTVQRLFFQFNQLTGTLPPELGGLDSIVQFRLDRNQLSGVLPPELINITDTVTRFKVSDSADSNCLSATGAFEAWLDVNDSGWESCS